ncbi:hypothetical protein ACQCSV_01545 [Pseudarthrobacter sp. S3]|uniref:hypothetical protein n=1 Tax=Pseudarthrobacter sp. S3 TaxID=3418419 RepID=UPI003CF73320
MIRHLGYRIPSPATLERIGTAFRRSVNSFAEANHIPLIRFAKEARKIEVMRRYLAAYFHYHRQEPWIMKTADGSNHYC